MLVKYRSNNSGGDWWLKDEDWLAPEKAGWRVSWIKDEEDSIFRTKGSDRWLGALAKECSKDFPTITDAIKEFEELTGMSVTDEGCNCCGAPHDFTWGDCAHGDCGCEGAHKDYHYASGDGLSEFMYGADLAKLSKRELLEKLKK